uniref:Putative methyltransferase n=1 Tax=viral metagenome TaxID=1070528 RepID=A0A6M3IKR1_9ZZZZ
MRGVIQIGAHWAEEYEGWLSMGVKHFLFFEPILSNFNKLCRILPKTDNIKTYRLALGNMTGVVTMYVETEHQGKSCSILEPYLHLEQYPDIEFTDRVDVQINKLDNIEYDRTLYDHLHVDAQGYELEVFKGAEESLESIETITTEVYRKELYKGCPMFEDITLFLRDRGFNLVDVFWRGNSWGDASFKR